MAGLEETRSRHPRFATAVLADAELAAALDGTRRKFGSRGEAIAQIVRLAWQSDAFLGQILYRAKAAMQRRGIPLLPRLCHRLAIATARIYIGDPVVVHPGVYILHGEVVIDGFTEVHGGVVIAPSVTLGLRGSWFGPKIGPGVRLGTGSRVLGEVTVGARARIGANAVVLGDVPAGATAIGVPARIVEDPDAGEPVTP